MSINPNPDRPAAVPPPMSRAAKAEALLLRFTAEAHRRKWSYDRGLDDDGVPVPSDGFMALHRLGEDMRLALEELRRTAPAAVSVVPPATNQTALRDRIAEALREHYLCTNRDEADADGNMPCRCGDWREPGAMGSDEDDWDTHLADVALAAGLSALADQTAQAPDMRPTAAPTTPVTVTEYGLQAAGEPLVYSLGATTHAAAEAAAAGHSMHLVQRTVTTSPWRNGMAVLPEQTDRAAEVAKHVGRAIFALKSPPPPGSAHYRSGWDDGLDAAMDAARDELLRRLAAEAQPTTKPETEAHPPHHRWYVETYDYLADEWAPGMRFGERAEAVARYETVCRNHPTWEDGSPVRRRFVRETTTYTVEPEPAA